MKRTTFQNLSIGDEFWWGAHQLENCNWGRKRSSRTADYRPLIQGELHPYTNWDYFPADKRIYIAN